MLNFKRNFGARDVRSVRFLLTLVCVLSFLVAGCLRGTRKSAEDLEVSGQNQSATFYVTQMPSPDIQPPTYDSLWKIPTGANYRMRACVIHRVTRDRIIGRAFRVTDGQNTYPAVTDGEGCMEWNEKIPFNFFTKNPQYLVFKRTIQGNGLDQGEQAIEFAIDPWKSSRGGDHAEFVFLRKPELLDEAHAVRDAAAIARLQRTGVAHAILTNDLVLDLKNSKELADGAEISMGMEMTPYVRLTRMDGTETDYNFTQGRFTVYAQILATNLPGSNGKNYLMTPHLVADSISMREGKLRFSFAKFKLKEELAYGNLVLAVKIVPLGQEDLKPYTATYRFGSFHDWLGTRSPLKEAEDGIDLGMTYEQLMRSIPATSEQRQALAQRAGIKPIEMFRFDYFSIKYSGISWETATRRIIKFEVSTCATLNLQGDIPARNRKFVITPSNGRDLPVQESDSEGGCIKWSDEVSHSYYKPEHYMIKEVAIREVESGYKRNFKIAINPWDLFATFGKDLRRVDERELRTEESIKNMPASVIESRFNLAQFDYTAIRFDYDINPDLSLNVKKTVLFRLSPEVQRYSSITEGRLATERLRDGIWLLKVAIQKDYVDPAAKEAIIAKDASGKVRYQAQPDGDARERQYMSYQEKLVRVINGRVISPVELTMEDLRLMRIRSNMLVQLEPVDELKLQMANSFKDFLDERSQIRERLAPVLADLQKARQSTAPNPQTRAATDVGAVSQDANRGERAEIENRLTNAEKERYYYQRMAAINQFLNQVDVGQLRDAIRTGDLAHLNRVVRDGSMFDSKGFLKDEKVVSGIPYNFKQSFNDFNNGVMDEGLLKALDGNRTGNGNSVYAFTTNKLNQLRLNDFTIQPAGPIVSLDFLIDPPEESGLRRRTFVGPVTFLHNYNGSEVRPTDNLDEVFCVSNTCDNQKLTEEQVQDLKFDDNSTYEWRKFYGWVAHFFNKHVDDLIFWKKGGERTVVDANGKSHVERRRGYDDLAARELKARSLISNFVKAYGLTFVSLTDEKLKSVRGDCPEPFYDESCLVDDPQNYLTKNDFLKSINDLGGSSNELGPYVEQLAGLAATDSQYAALGNKTVSAEAITDFVKHENSRAADTAGNSGRTYGWLGPKLCFLLVDNLMMRLLDLKAVNPDMAKHVRKNLALDCYKDIAERETLDANNPVISIDPRYRVYQTGRKQFKGGKSLNINIGQSLSLSESQGVSFSRGLDSKIDSKDIISGAAGFLKFFPQIGKSTGGAGMGRAAALSDEAAAINEGANAFADGIGDAASEAVKKSAGSGLRGKILGGLGTGLVGAAIGAVKNLPPTVSVGLGWDSGEGRSLGTDISKGTFLVAQIATFDIELLDYEKCLVVSLKHQALQKYLNYESIFNPIDKKPFYTPTPETEGEIARALSAGYFICEGHAQKPPPKIVRERYYYITQHFVEGDMLDSGDLFNHPWLLAIRGSRDFQTFMISIHDIQKGSLSAKDLAFEFASDITDGTDDETNQRAQVKSYTWSIDHMVDAYLNVLPTFPGLYAPSKAEPQDFPWNTEDNFDQFGGGLGPPREGPVPVAMPKGF